MGPVILFFFLGFFLVFRGFGYWDMGSVILFFCFLFFEVFDPSQQRKQSDLHCKRWMHIRHRDV